MDVSTFVLLSSEAALRRRMDVTANNIANLNTTGFKREAPVFREIVDSMNTVPAVPGSGRNVSFVIDMGVTHDTAQGAFQATGNPLDAMIQGEGYFQLRRADGTIAFTRAGHFQVSAAGQLVGSGGHPVMSDTGQPIQVPVDDASRLAIAADGTILGEQGEIGRIGVYRFANEALLTQAGDSLFDGPGAAAVPPGEVELKVGGVEGSNVNAVVESAEMIEIMRSYQTSQRMADNINDIRRRSIGRLASIK